MVFDVILGFYLCIIDTFRFFDVWKHREAYYSIEQLPASAQIRNWVLRNAC